MAGASVEEPEAEAAQATQFEKLLFYKQYRSDTQRGSKRNFREIWFLVAKAFANQESFRNLELQKTLNEKQVERRELEPCPLSDLCQVVEPLWTSITSVFVHPACI